ncbi:hypothetical protein SLUN_36980 [Streptomyces lunaelactis]|uniref:Uncharacterized protein n=2 Tax=Streptomyces lunaelactis TaxID=1535768 RepID=A0A2R4TCU5_9ACTN|nr:hypothetical protein SLUN_36980 [Streptomyces lunaelactis]NUK83289.1 hypothetical protein [Streptomyces lunaelactis]
MTGGQRVVIVASGVGVGLLAGAFCLMSWDRADQVAGIASAFLSVAALGVAVWAVMAGTTGSRLRASNTGKATVRGGGTANTGVVLPNSGVSDSTVHVQKTGAAESDGGQANTGITPQ